MKLFHLIGRAIGVKRPVTHFPSLILGVGKMNFFLKTVHVLQGKLDLVVFEQRKAEVLVKMYFRTSSKVICFCHCSLNVRNFDSYGRTHSLYTFMYISWPFTLSCSWILVVLEYLIAEDMILIWVQDMKGSTVYLTYDF